MLILILLNLIYIYIFFSLLYYPWFHFRFQNEIYLLFLKIVIVCPLNCFEQVTCCLYTYLFQKLILYIVYKDHRPWEKKNYVLIMYIC